MSTSRILFPVLGACAALLFSAWSPGTAAHTSVNAQAPKAASVGNPITGEGLPNPAPNVIRNWGEHPEGR